MQPTVPRSLADELAKLASLRDRGVLSDQEFRVEKAKILR
jgi:Short C-terminal domain